MLDLLLNGFRYAFLEKKVDDKVENPLRIGLLGASNIARFGVIKPCAKSADATVHAVAARSFDKAKAYAKKHGISVVYETYEDLLSAEDVDAVYIGLRTESHAEYALAAIEQHKHVLVEKPLSVTAEEAEEIRALAAANDVVVFEGMHYRYHPLSSRIREIVDSGELGNILEINTNVGNFSPFAWREGNNVSFINDSHIVKMLNLFCYCVDVSRFVLNDPEISVEDDLHVHSVTIEKHKFIANVAVKGIPCEMISRRDEPSFPVPYWNLRIVGTNSVLTVDNFGMPFLYHTLTLLSTDGNEKIRSEKHYGNWNSTFDYQLEAFIDSVSIGKSFSSTVFSALQNAKIVDQIVAEFKANQKESVAGEVEKHVDRNGHTKLRVGTWNLLADGLATNEFMTKGGDAVSTNWFRRRSKLISSLTGIFETLKCDILATQENDHPNWIHHELKKKSPNIGMLIMPLCSQKKYSTCLKSYSRRISNELTLHHYGEGQICEFGCNGVKPGCSSSVDDSSFEEHIQKASLYLKENPGVRKVLMRNGITCSTCAEEHEPTDENWLHLADDRLVLYFNKGRFKDWEVVVTKDISFVCFTDVNGGIINVFPAHLASGESYVKEMKRVRELKSILDVAKHVENPVILMDSNTSDSYEHQYHQNDDQLKETVTTCLSEYGFQVARSSVDTSQCFKMRHAQGAQQNKFGAFMFDTIDKVCVQHGTEHKFVCIPDEIFKKYDIQLLPLLQNWRSNPSLREYLRDACVKLTWGENITLNDTGALDDVLLIRNNMKPKQTVKNVLSQLYPNVDAPSDHPPLIVDLQVQEKF